MKIPKTILLLFIVSLILTSCSATTEISTATPLATSNNRSEVINQENTNLEQINTNSKAQETISSNDDQISVITIGTGTPQYSESKASASTAIKYNDHYYIIDCGDGSYANLEDSGIDYSKIEGIFFTHHHIDHTSDFFDLYVRRATISTSPLAIIGPPRTGEFVEFANTVYLDDILYRKYNTTKNIKSIDKDEIENFSNVSEIIGEKTFKLNGMTITTAVMSHTMYTLAYRFDIGDTSIVISGDTSYNEDLITLSKDADILVVDGNLYKSTEDETTSKRVAIEPFYEYGGDFSVEAHMNFDDMVKTAVNANVKTLVITHYNETTEVRINNSISKINEQFNGEVIYATDIQEIHLDSSASSTTDTTTNQLSYPIVDTNQTEFYSNTNIISEQSINDPYYGQDATYLLNPPSYTNNNDGTITDNVTNLMWAQDLGEKMTFDEAFVYANSSELGGYTDWRVPTIKELYSLIQFDGRVLGEKATDELFIDTDYFIQPLGDTTIGEREIDAQTWSSTEYVGTTMNNDATVFGVNFIDGRIKGYPKSNKRTKTDNQMYVRLVRANTEYGINNFVDNDDGTITDLATGLMWQQYDSESGMDWENALEYAEDLTLSEYDDWRLPNAKELQSIVDYTKSLQTTNSAAIDDMFYISSIENPDGSLNYPYFWSSTTHLDGQNPYATAVYVAFGEAIGEMNGTLMDVHGAGAQRSDPKSGDEDDYPVAFGPQGDIRIVYNFVRCVRND